MTPHPDRIAQLTALALTLGVAELPAWLRRNGHPIGIEVLALEAAFKVKKGQSGPTVDAATVGRDGDPMPLVYRYVDAARLLDISESTVKRLVAGGDLRAINLAGARCIPHDELVDYVARRLDAA